MPLVCLLLSNFTTSYTIPGHSLHHGQHYDKYEPYCIDNIDLTLLCIMLSPWYGTWVIHIYFIHIQRHRKLLGLIWAWHNITTPLKWFPTFGFNKSWVQKYNLHVMTCCKLSSNSFSYVRHLLFHWCLLCRNSWTYQKSELNWLNWRTLNFASSRYTNGTLSNIFILNSSLSRWSGSRRRWHW